jgi:tetratricopeptide (TPR) repeat protein
VKPVNAPTTIDPREFVSLVQPLLERQDLPGLITLLKSRWDPEQIIGLLYCDDEDARKVATLIIGLVGTKCCVNALAPRLQDPDPIVNAMAEHALWTIWFRCGTPEANHQLARGAQAVNRRDFAHAVCHFNRAIDLDPTLAEAYNQRALAYYLQERYDESIEDGLRAVERMPCHFGAWAGLGHCYAHAGRLDDAVRCYERALAINPHLETVRTAIESLRQRLSA